jgi:hypothetical protein
VVLSLVYKQLFNFTNNSDSTTVDRIIAKLPSSSFVQINFSLRQIQYIDLTIFLGLSFVQLVSVECAWSPLTVQCAQYQVVRCTVIARISNQI